MDHLHVDEDLMFKELHDYQKELKAGIYQDWNAGNRNVLAVLPTGGGKSVVVSDIVYDSACMGMRQTIIAHREELVSQMSIHVAERGIHHRIIGPSKVVSHIMHLHRETFNGQCFVNPKAPTSVAGVDTIISRKDELQPWAIQQDQWITDEAHHLLRENKWGKAAAMFINARGLGVTATPTRSDGCGLGAEYDGVFNTMVIGPTMRDLINRGRLSEYEIVCPESDLQMTDDDITAKGDFSPKKMRDKAKKSKIVGDVVREYCRYAFGKRAICFATDVETAGEIANSFNAAGIRAAALSAKTDDAVRKKYVDEFKSGKLTILINVDLFGEGFDCPACEVVILARPTASLGLYLQMVGRSLRTADGKIYGLIIDHVSNVVRHGLPDKPHVWTLARRDRRGKQAKDPEQIDLTICKNPNGRAPGVPCGKPYEKFRTCCPYCGYVPPLPEPRQRSIQQVEGNLVLLDRAKLEQMRASMFLESPGDMALRIGEATGVRGAGKAHANKQIEKFAAQKRLGDAIAQWAAIQRMKGRPDDESYRRFYHTTGVDVMTAMSSERTRQEYEALAATVESWYMQ